MKSPGEFMEILAAFDLTQSYRGAAEACGVLHNTVRSYVKALEERAEAPIVRQRGRITDPFLPPMTSLVEQSRGKIRTTRCVLAGLKSKYRANTGHKTPVLTTLGRSVAELWL